MLEIKRVRSEKDAFEVRGRFADSAANKALLDAVGHLPSVRLFLRGLTTGNSTALSHFLESLDRNDYPPITYCELSDYWLRCLNLVPQMLREKDTIESVVLLLENAHEERDEVLLIGKDIPLLDSYEDYDPRFVVDGKSYELGIHHSGLFVLSRIAKRRQGQRSAS